MIEEQSLIPLIRRAFINTNLDKTLTNMDWKVTRSFYILRSRITYQRPLKHTGGYTL